MKTAFDGNFTKLCTAMLGAAFMVDQFSYDMYLPEGAAEDLEGLREAALALALSIAEFRKRKSR